MKNKPDVEQVAWVIEKLMESMKMGGVSYRYLIYDIMGFDESAYGRLQEAGLLGLNNMLYDFINKYYKE